MVFIPKCRRKDAVWSSCGGILGEVFRKLAEQKESRIEEGHLMPDHVHMMISIPPKYAVSQVVGYHQGQERDSSGAGVRRAEAQFRRAALLGQRLLRFDGRARRGGDPRIHHEPRGGGQALGSAEPVALSSHLQVAP